MDIKKLIERLPWWADHCDRTNYGCRARIFLLDAATALSTLQAENEKLRAELKYKAELIQQQANELERRDKILKEQEAELERVTAERNAAVEAANGLDKIISRAWGAD